MAEGAEDDPYARAGTSPYKGPTTPGDMHAVRPAGPSDILSLEEPIMINIEAVISDADPKFFSVHVASADPTEPLDQRWGSSPSVLGPRRSRR